jgi:hypothetical protein
MIKKIDFGKTSFSDLHEVFHYKTRAEFDEKKTRLFPTGNTDNEISTTSILLASLSAVKEFREELFIQIGFKRIKVNNIVLHAYTEISNKKTNDRPDGLIVITSGKHKPIIEWAGFIESKVQANQLDNEQIENYIDFARQIGINNIITISNDLVTNPTQSPIESLALSLTTAT